MMAADSAIKYLVAHGVVLLLLNLEYSSEVEELHAEAKALKKENIALRSSINKVLDVSPVAMMQFEIKSEKTKDLTGSFNQSRDYNSQ